MLFFFFFLCVLCHSYTRNLACVVQRLYPTEKGPYELETLPNMTPHVCPELFRELHHDHKLGACGIGLDEIASRSLWNPDILCRFSKSQNGYNKGIGIWDCKRILEVPLENGIVAFLGTFENEWRLPSPRPSVEFGRRRRTCH